MCVPRGARDLLIDRIEIYPRTEVSNPYVSGGGIVARVGLAGDFGGFAGALLDHCETLI